MARKTYAIYILILAAALCSMKASAQYGENIAPVQYNPFVKPAGINPLDAVLKTTALSLPFFEDFAGYSPYPDTNKWIGRQVYINNTMGVDPVSRGVATFDALNDYGLPYNTSNSQILLFADTLTSKPINTASNQPADSLYLSFFYQPQGNGFYPESSDSLFLYLKRKNNTWAKVWAKEGTQLQPFRQVMISVADTNFFSESFQFRFINKASINTNDDVWNIDYIRLYAGRNLYDTSINDVAFSNEPSFLLNDYTSMPYQQFLANPGKERTSQVKVYMHNSFNVQQSANIYYTARELQSGALLSIGAPVSQTLPPMKDTATNLSTYNSTSPIVKRYDWVCFENTYYVDPVGSSAVENDTIKKGQVFHNYFSYDDGTAEKSYFLNLFPTLPGKLAIEYHLNQPDTLTGMAVYFGRQVPTAENKTFSAQVYSSIAVNGAGDNLLYQQDFLQPGYLATNNFYVYKFDQPVPLPAGTFYIGAMQPAFSNSDSLYYGLDANRVGGNHVYYNVMGDWQGSTVNGAVMIRPIVGPIIPSKVKDAVDAAHAITISPNPAADRIHIQKQGGWQTGMRYDITDMQGRTLLQGNLAGSQIDISALVPGIYIIRIADSDRAYPPQKIHKL